MKLLLFALILTLSACDQNARTPQRLQEQRTCPQTNKILSDEEVINAAVSMLLDSNKFEVERDIINLEGIIDYVDIADFLTQNPKCCRFSNDEFVEDYLNNGFLSTYSSPQLQESRPSSVPRFYLL